MDDANHPAVRRAILAIVAALIPMVPVIAGIAITSGHVSAAATTGPRYTPAGLRTASTLASTPQFGGELPPGRGELVALVQRPTALRSRPGGRVLARLGTRTEYGSPQALWVVRHTAKWLGVVTPILGNGRIGWLAIDDASLSREPWQLQVSLSARELTVVHAGRAVERFKVAIGMPSAPTPTGRFAVTDRLDTGDPAGPYGCCILALSAVAPHAIQGWSGGNRIAIHSTPETWTIGEAASHGCLRLTLAAGRWLLGHIPLGTPVVISS